MSATNFPEFNAAVTELTTKVSNLLGDVAAMQSVANVQVAVDKAAAASQSATDAAASAGSASTSATSATTSKNAAATSATKAGQWAENAENVTVETGKYSAKHHAIKSAASATSASASAATATTKASEASTSATSAAGSAATATTKASEAGTSASIAATKASEASSSATSASSSMTKASQWAENAENTAVEAGKYSAKHHALKAAASASAASSSQTSAASSASTATTKASEASTSATNAAASAATASTKASESSTSAANSSASATKASQWAENAENTAVEAGKYSAKHHALKAAASATSASSSAATATTKAGEAATSATNAANSAATATTKASEAATSAANAANANTAAQSAKTAAEAARDEAVTAASSLTGTLSELGSVDLSSGAYPTTPISAGFWKVTVGGTVGGVDYGVGDTLVYSKNLDEFYKIDNTESVSSVNGKTGAVSLTKTDVGLGNVDDTSDANKPVSTAQQAALDGKVDKVSGKGLSTNDLTAALLNKLNASAPLESPALTGNPTAPTPAAWDNDTSIATTAFVRSAMGLFGLGADAPDISNLNTLVTPGQYVASSSATGFPPGALSRAFVNVQRSVTSTTFVGQTATFPVDYTGGAGMAERFSQDSGATWGAWQSIWHTGNLVKQTSQTDTTAGALMAVGAFGNGRHLDLRGTVFENGTPADVFGKGMVSGFARGGPDGLKIPVITSNSVFGVLSVYGHWTDGTGGAGSAWREFRTSGGRVYHQDQSYGAWGAWREVFNTGNQLSLGTTPAAAQTALELVKGTSPGNVLVAGAELVGKHTVECFAFLDAGSVPGATIYTNIPASESIMPNLIIRGALNGYTEPFEARLSWYFYGGAIYLPNVLITATGGVSGVRFYLRAENGKIIIRIDFGGNAYISRLAFDALCIPGGYTPDPSSLRGWSAVASNAVGSGEVEARRARTYHSRNILGPVSQSGGIPTGAIIETGANSNGRYTRYADGTQICTQRHLVSLSIAAETVSPGLTWTFPAPFANADWAGSVTNRSGWAYDYLASFEWGSATEMSPIYIKNLSKSSRAMDHILNLIAIGRWY